MSRRRRRPADAAGRAVGLDSSASSSRAFDWFTNQAARTGLNTTNLAAGTEYTLNRYSYNYMSLVALYRNNWVSRRIVDTPVQDLIRTWPNFVCDIDPDGLALLDRAVRRTQAKSAFDLAIKWARLFGGAGLLIVVDGHEDKLEEPLDLSDVPLHSYKGVIPFDRWSGITPDANVCTDITRPLDFGKPEYYQVRTMGGGTFRVHCSRIIRFTGPLVPTPEREAQSHWGISVLEPVYEEILKRDNMSWNILSLTFRANLLGMKFDQLAQLASGLGANQQAQEQFEKRLVAFNHMLNNQSLIPLPENGGLEAASYSFTGLSDCYQQFQLDVSGAAQIPVSRLWGRTISGLGQSNDADEMIYEERINSEQDCDMRPALEKLYPVICMSELGEVPEDSSFNFPSVRVPTEKERAELAQTVVATLNSVYNDGIISPRTFAEELLEASDKTGIFSNIKNTIDQLSDKPIPSGGEFGDFSEAAGLPGLPDPGRELSSTVKLRAGDADGPVVEHRVVHGLDILVETPKGGVRRGDDWEVTLPYDYGYIPGVMGADGDSMDVALGPQPAARTVFVINQRKLPPDEGFDEHKCFIGYPTKQAVMKAFRDGHHKAADVFISCAAMDIAEFKNWLKGGDHSKPCGGGAGG